MKERASRKKGVQISPKGGRRKVEVPTLPKFKFNLSKDNLSCFIGSQHPNKTAVRKNSRSLCKNKKPEAKTKVNNKKSLLEKNLPKKEQRQEGSPDLLKELPNTIISRIEKRGVMCPWNQPEQLPFSKQSNNEFDTESLWTAFSSSNTKSYASTNDQAHYQPFNYFQFKPLNHREPSSAREHKINSFSGNDAYTIQSKDIRSDPRTTIMIRNIPNRYSINDLAEEIDEDFKNLYDFLYLPCDFNNQCNVGYGFINFITTQALPEFYSKFHQQKWRKFKSQKICALTYARLQGLSQLIEHFQNSKVLNQKEKKYRPIIKYDKIQQMVLAQQKR